MLSKRALVFVVIVIAAAVVMGACKSDKKSNTSYPSAGEDVFENTTATVHIELTPEGVSAAPLRQETETIELQGPARIARSDPEKDGDVYVVHTEIVEMELTGTASFGELIVRESADKQSTGEVRQKVAGEDFPADSFFDVFVDVEVPDLNMMLHNEEPMRMTAELNGLPPAEGDGYMGEDDRPLYTPAGLQVGRIVDARHIPNPPPPPGGTEEPTEPSTTDPAATATAPAAETPAGPEGGTFSAVIEVAEGGDPAGHQEFVEQDDTMPDELEVTVAGSTITISGAPPFVEVTGTLSADGSFSASGSGTVAGRPNISVTFEGTLVDGTLTGSYSLGAGGELPQGQPIAYDVLGDLM